MSGDFVASHIELKGVQDRRARRTFQPSAGVQLRYAWLMVLAFLLQVYAVYGLGSGAPEVVRKSLIVGSYSALLFTVWSNRRWHGMVLLGVGLVLNFLAIVANGGLMPVAPETMMLAGKTERLGALAIGQWVPASKDLLLPADQTALWLLTDVLVYRSALGGSRIFSIGDVVILLGLFLLVADLLRSRLLPPART